MDDVLNGYDKWWSPYGGYTTVWFTCFPISSPNFQMYVPQKPLEETTWKLRFSFTPERSTDIWDLKEKEKKIKRKKKSNR